MDTQRLILLFIFGFSLLMLWEAWEREQRPKPPPAPVSAPRAPAAPASPTPQAAAPAIAQGSAVASGQTVRVTTDLVSAEIDTVGGTLRRVELLGPKDSTDSGRNLVLMNPSHSHCAQNCITCQAGPDH